jgi:hypothetical protein
MRFEPLKVWPSPVENSTVCLRRTLAVAVNMLALAACSTGDERSRDAALSGANDAGAPPDAPAEVASSLDEADAAGANVGFSDDAPQVTVDAAVADTSLERQPDVAPDHGGSVWIAAPVAPTTGSGCSDASYVSFNEEYQKWIAIILCTPVRYKVLMAVTKEGPYLDIGDLGGSGQDQCELVNPEFTLPDEDDIKSGGCATCQLGPFRNPGDTQPGPPGWSRSRLDESFVPVVAWPKHNMFTPAWLECGIALP